MAWIFCSVPGAASSFFDIKAEWLAFEEGTPNGFCVQQQSTVRREKNSNFRSEFPIGTLERPPSLFMALDHIDHDHEANLWVRISALYFQRFDDY